jgi:SWI/SNF-related matrix-associated actin-dependent regulator 1 of chromatin subfamily A
VQRLDTAENLNIPQSPEDPADEPACSLDQAAIIIKHRPYTSVDDVRYKLTKARGVSMKLFEQYTEIMEGYVQIDACLNKCEGIANDIASTLSVWRSASMGQDGSVIGTPRADGLNDVKVDVNKVSELLRNETDSRKRKILGQYIKEQPSKLSKGTVLKDYQLLGVNWLNLLFAKKIGCILADEMGEFWAKAKLIQASERPSKSLRSSPTSMRRGTRVLI